jgi:hypothetical protein
VRVTRYQHGYTVRMTTVEMACLRKALTLVDWDELYASLDTAGRRSLSRRGPQANFLATDRIGQRTWQEDDA